MTSTIDIEPASDELVRRRRIGYTLTSLFLFVVMALGVVDALGWFDTYGVDTDSVSASGGGYELAVRYGTVSRPALATPFEIEVTRVGGFDGPVTVAVTRHYMQMWDENGLLPSPSAETSGGDFVEWEFDPPAGDTLTVFYDGRIEPAVQSGRDGAVAVLEDGVPVVGVEFHTRVLP